jgi:hypothetical protein
MFILWAGILFLMFGGMWRTFSKAGQPGWACLIPIYNYIVMADVGRVSRMNVLYMFLSGLVFMPGIFILETDPDMPLSIFGVLLFIAGLVLTTYFQWKIYRGIAVNYGQPPAFAIGLLLLNVIFFAILGFGNYKYIGGDNSYQSEDILDSGL